MSAVVTPLRQSDEPIVREWARDFLRANLSERATIYGHPMTADEVEAHIERHELVSALWHDVVHADYADAEFVAVVRRGTAPVGLVLAEERLEPYLRVSIGVVRWVYVDADARRAGVSRSLVAAAERWMSQRRLRGREIILAAGNHAALSLFRKYGYTDTEVRLAHGVRT